MAKAAQPIAAASALSSVAGGCCGSRRDGAARRRRWDQGDCLEEAGSGKLGADARRRRRQQQHWQRYNLSAWGALPELHCAEDMLKADKAMHRHNAVPMLPTAGQALRMGMDSPEWYNSRAIAPEEDTSTSNAMLQCVCKALQEAERPPRHVDYLGD